MKPIKATSSITVSSIVFGLALIASTVGAVQFLRGSDPVSGASGQVASVQLKDGQFLNVQTREVTVAQWQSCFDAGACQLDLSSRTRSPDYPATGLSHPDTVEYATWLNATTKGKWRLPTASEWHEIAAEVLPEKPDPIFTDPSLTWASTYLTDADRTGRTLRPSGTFTATSAGIEDLDGNVWEWTQDCYAGANGQGALVSPDRCPAFIMGGEHEAVMSYLVRDPARGGCAVGAPPAHLGMRLVSDGKSSDA